MSTNTRKSDNVKALTVKSVKGTELAAYGEREVVLELVDRMMDYHSAIREIREIRGEDEALAVGRDAAQKAILMGASPLEGTNELHVWSEQKTKTVFVDDPKHPDRQIKKAVKYWVDHVELGKNYWARRGRQVAGGITWIVEPRLMEDEELEEYLIADTEIAAICKGYRMDDLERRLPLVQVGMMTPQEAKSGIVFTGIGTVKRGEYAKNGRPLSWTAIERARKDFYKSATPLIPGERLDPGEGLSRDEDGNVVLNTSRLNMEVVDLEVDRESKHSEEELAKFAAELFEDPNDSDIITRETAVSEGDVIEAEFEDTTGTEIPFDDDEVEELAEELGGEVVEVEEEEEELSPEEEARKFFSSLQEVDPRVKAIDFETWNELHDVDGADFMKWALGKVERYANAKAFGGAAKLLGYTGVPRGMDKERISIRTSIFLDVNYYAALRNAGMSQEDARASLETIIGF